ncbi:MAG: nickel-dependent lactate racemase [Candidatus Lokiarchaeota archaeon]|nr:nickel-dependent lactate racemase [Candidatus Lokiarchaeota archaeon]MBD3342633.1 nickel-dependent lactate racemase [Candidatus Lokiarchaeota archaeon]
MKIDYGKNGLEIEIDPLWKVDILRPLEQKAIIDPVEKIRSSIRNPIGLLPLRELLKQKDTLNQICIVVSDATRPVPTHIILQGLIKELNEYGIKDQQIIILIATGLHRPSREEEIQRIIGNDLKNRIKVINHKANNKNELTFLGDSSKEIPIYINTQYYQSDFKILTGYVEPHFFFGFSGGRKSLIPGIAGKDSILGNHSAKMIDSPYSRFGIFHENLMHQNALEFVKKVGVDFCVNVCINENHKIVKVTSGDIFSAHQSLVSYQKQVIFRTISKPYDIVICGNGGYPLDLNLYQAVKSMALGELAVKKGGTIISVNECEDGIGVGQDDFKSLLFSGMTPEKIHRKILNGEILLPDQWEIQILVRILMKATVYIVSSLKEDEIGNIGLKHVKTVEIAIKKAFETHGKEARILILPNGPQVIPILEKY